MKPRRAQTDCTSPWWLTDRAKPAASCKRGRAAGKPFVCGMNPKRSGRAIVLLWCLGTWAYLFAKPSATPVDETAPLIVNRYAVSAEEFRWFMLQERAYVFQDVKTKCNIDYGKDFWNRDCAGTTPKKIIEKRTIDRIVRDKVQQLLFKDLGLIQDASYSAFLENLEKLNASRERAVQLGQVIYGPVRYSALQYYGHWMATLQIQAKEKLAQERLGVTDEQLQALARKKWPNRPYEKNKELVKAKYVDQAYQKLVDEMVAKAMVRTNAEAVDVILVSGQEG